MGDSEKGLLMNNYLKTLLFKIADYNNSASISLVSYFKQHQQYPLLAIHPFIQYCIDSILQLGEDLALRIDDQTIREDILNDIRQIWEPRLQRCFVVEFHQLQSNNVLQGDTEEERYDTFVKLFERPNIITEFLSKYPVIAYQLEIFIKNYNHSFKEVFRHLQLNYDTLNKNFWAGKYSNAKLMHISFVGDPHNNFRRVTILSFIDDANNEQAKIVYKPRSVYNEQCYNQFIAWVNDKATLTLKTPKCLDKKSYGWCEYIHFKKCTNENEVINFYYELGCLIAITYILNISDIHYENLLAHGRHPVIVDLECMVPPALFNQEGTFCTVLQSGILTRYVRGKENFMDTSALSGGMAQESLFSVFKMKYTAAQGFRVQREKTRLRQHPNIPMLVGEIVAPEAYQAQLLKGFETIYRLILAKKNECIQGPLDLFKISNTRLVLRSTKTYIQLHHEITHPKLLHTKAAYTNYLTWVKKEQNYGNEVAKSEYEQLKKGDIPAFYANAANGSVYDAYGKIIPIPLAKLGAECLLDRVQKLSERDLVAQKKLIEQSFVTISLNKAQQYRTNIPNEGKYKPQNLHKRLQSKYLANAKCLLDDL